MTASCGPTPGAPESTVIRAEEADLDVLSFVIAEAFGDLAPSRWLIPGQAARREIFPGYFRLHLENALACGVVHTTPGRTAAALWLPGGAGTAWPPDGYDERLAAATSPWTGRFTAFDAALGHRHPAVPHHYLAILAVRPDRQGRGTGTALLDACHAVLDRDPDMPAYLEAAGPRSRGLYLVHGYRDHGPPIHLPDGPAMYPMMRQPRGRGPDMPAETGTAQAGPGAGALPAVLTHILAVCPLDHPPGAGNRACPADLRQGLPAAGGHGPAHAVARAGLLRDNSEPRPGRAPAQRSHEGYRSSWAERGTGIPDPGEP